MTDLYQVTSVAAALPNSGTGLNVNGFNFGFSAKNGNGWDNGQQDYLTAYVRFYGPSGNTVANYDYNLNYKFDWTYFNFSKTFDTPYASKDLTAARFGFVGGDSNYWAGNYGPEITNISFSLKYSVDPCATNPMFSPTCPGYLDALAKLMPVATTTVTADPITTTATSPTSTTTIVTDPVASTVSVSNTTTAGQPSVVAPVVSAPTATTSTSSTSTSTASSSQSTKETASSSGTTGLALSIISKNSERDAAGAAVAQSAVSQAQQAASQAQQEAANVAASSVANSISANIVSVGGQQSNGTGIRINNAANNTQLSLSANSAMFATTNTSSTTGPAQVSAIQQNVESLTANTLTQSLVTAGITSGPVATGVTQTVETYSLIPANFLTDKTNPLTDIVEGKQEIPQSSSSTSTGPVVNKNAQDNEIAGGVNINKMAASPLGYGDYLNFAMKDVAFYAPKEVYKNQRNVDNANVLRQLTNDSRHRALVELQYAR